MSGKKRGAAGTPLTREQAHAIKDQLGATASVHWAGNHSSFYVKVGHPPRSYTRFFTREDWDDWQRRQQETEGRTA